MTKSDLIDAVAGASGLPQQVAGEVVGAVFAAMQAALVRGDRIEIRGFGSLKAKHYAAYTGRNPKTGVPIAVPAKVGPVFKAGREMCRRLMSAVEDG